MEARNFAIITYGCQMNKYDSERIAGTLHQLHYERTEDLSSADLILLNTCSVREKADQKVFSKLGRLRNLKRENPNLIIGVCGCIPQVQGEDLLDRSSVVDLVFGTQNIHQLPELLREIQKGKKRVARILEKAPEERAPFQDSFLRESNFQAWVSIMTGCDNFCSYCIVPFTRGRERSRRAEDIIGEIEDLASRGYKEVTLLGQNVNSYGRDLPCPMSFPELLQKVNSLPGIERIRFVTSHPKDLSEELMESMKDLGKVCESLHLPLQSGSDTILQKMNRGYTHAIYMEKVRKLKSLIPGMALSTDIIVGFPGESEKDFKETERAMQEAGFHSSFIFKYSPRPGTVAESFPGRLDDGALAERFERLEEIQRKMTKRYHCELEGKELEVLVEGKSKTNPSKLSGRTRTNKIVVFPGPETLKGSLVRLEIVHGGLYSLEGRLSEDISLAGEKSHDG